jgi:hypothetical protein
VASDHSASSHYDCIKEDSGDYNVGSYSVASMHTNFDSYTARFPDIHPAF